MLDFFNFNKIQNINTKSKFNQNEIILFKSLIYVFLGFLIFLSAIANKIFSLNKFNYYLFTILENYFVLFVFFGLILFVVGLFDLFVWNFLNRKPYIDVIRYNTSSYNTSFKNNNLTFFIYLVLGVFFVFLGFLSLFYFNFEKIIRFLGLISSTTGIILLVIGLYLFLKYIYFEKNQ